MRRAFTIVVSVAIGAAALLVAIVLIGWHRQNVASDKNEAAAIKAIEAAAAALRASPLTVGQLKTLATPRSDPDRVDAVNSNGTVMISFGMSARYADPGAISDAAEVTCFQGIVQRSESTSPELAEIPCTQVNPLPNADTEVSLPPR